MSIEVFEKIPTSILIIVSVLCSRQPLQGIISIDKDAKRGHQEHGAGWCHMDTIPCSWVTLSEQMPHGGPFQPVPLWESVGLGFWDSESCGSGIPHWRAAASRGKLWHCTCDTTKWQHKLMALSSTHPAPSWPFVQLCSVPCPVLPSAVSRSAQCHSQGVPITPVPPHMALLMPQ